MSWNNADELVVAANGAVYFAPTGTALPQPGDDPTDDLDTAFVGVGLLTEDGVTHSIGSEVTDFMSWQSLDPVRRERTSSNKSATFTLQQWNEENVVFAFGGGDVTDHGGGLYSYVFPEGDDPLNEVSVVVDEQDGDVNRRFVYARGNVTDTVETQAQRGALSVLPITFQVLRPSDESRSAYFLTDSPAFALGS